MAKEKQIFWVHSTKVSFISSPLPILFFLILRRLRALYQNILCTIEAAGGEGKESLTSLIMHLESQLDGATLNKTAAAIPSVEFDTRHLAREDPVGNDGDDDNKFLVMGARHGDGLSNL